MKTLNNTQIEQLLIAAGKNTFNEILWFTEREMQFKIEKQGLERKRSNSVFMVWSHDPFKHNDLNSRYIYHFELEQWFKVI